MRVDTAALTGESKPKRRTAEPVEEDNVIDLMAALKKSLKAKGGGHPAAGRRKAR